MRKIKNCYEKENNEDEIWIEEYTSFYVNNCEISIGLKNEREISLWRDNKSIEIWDKISSKIKRIKIVKQQS